MSTLRAAVYQRYWSTMGGGEQFAAGLAVALARRFAVDLVGPEPFDAAVFAERLGVDLSGMGQLVVPGGDSSVAAAVRNHDLFVNATYLSAAPNVARHGLYVVHFPGVVPARVERSRHAAAWSAAQRLGRPFVRFAEGFHAPEEGGWARWTNGFAVMEVWAPTAATFSFTVSGEHRPGGEPVELVVRADAREVFRGTLQGRARLDVPVPGGEPVTVVVASPAFNPARVLGIPDNRDLGVVVRDLAFDGAPRLAQRGRRPAWTEPPAPFGFARTYDRVLSNSAYTARWVRELWGVPSEVLYPPVELATPGEKKPIVLSIGRFFDAGSGHSKKQLELVRAFRALVDQGASGWEFHLVGGCDPKYRAYAMEVKRQARGYPIHVHLSAPGAVVAELRSAASIYWHATGLGEDLTVHPVRAEHFGIALVEAMSAGAVPVVFGAGGPAEIVRDGVDGHQVSDEAGFVTRTRWLIDHPDELRSLAAAARRRAETFSRAAFERRFLATVDEVLGAPSPPAGLGAGQHDERDRREP